MKQIKFIILLLVVVTLYSCVDDRDLSNNTVIAHISSNPDGLHPYNDNSANRTYIFNYTQQTLVSMDIEKLEIEPQLIKSMPSVSEDGLEYTYELKEGIKWDDGSAFTVDDVFYTFKKGNS